MFSLKEFLGLDYYTSPLDEFLHHYDKAHPILSASQQQEVKKYQRIYQLRDQANTPEQKDTFWDKF